MNPYTTYTFLPSLRSGLAAFQEMATSTGGPRSRLNVELNIKGRKIDGEEEKLELSAPAISLYGPGDILGFHPRIVIRTDPQPDTGTFEANYFPAVEFGDPDFAWRYSRFPQTDQGMTPWITLIVLVTESWKPDVAPEYTEKPPAGKALPPAITVLNAGALPKIDQTKYWAHVQITADSEITDYTQYLTSQSEQAICRLLCPRRLHAKTKYTAFVVPTHELGRRAGLGLPQGGVSGSAPAWNNDEVNLEIPYYYRWEFITSEFGDFEYLVRLLKQQELTGLGARPIDCSNPGFDVAPVEVNNPELGDKHFLGLEGALRSVDTDYTVWGADNAGEAPPKFQTDLAALLNHNFGQKPIVAPPVYGRWYAPLKSGISPRPVYWLSALNFDPRHRVAAGLGTEVINKQQEALMASAWEQLGDAPEINSSRRIAQNGIEISARFHSRVGQIRRGDNLMLLYPLLKNNILTNEDQRKTATTVLQNHLESALRRIARRSGPIRKRQGAYLPPLVPLMGKNPSSILDIFFPSSDPPFPGPVAMPNIPPGSNRLKVIQQKLNRCTQPIAPITVEEGNDDPVTALFEALQNGIDPNIQIETRVNQTVDSPLLNIGGGTAFNSLDDIRWAPEFPQPMYKALSEAGHQLVLPGVEKIPQNTIGLLKTNRRFIEAFLCGCNHAFAGELLWREFPTDLRGTYFRQFWDVQDRSPEYDLPSSFLAKWAESKNKIAFNLKKDPTQFLQQEKEKKLSGYLSQTEMLGLDEMEKNQALQQILVQESHEEKGFDIKNIHEWDGKSLGENGNSTDDKLVLVIRGDLLRRYPNTIVYAVDATKGADGKWVPDMPEYLSLFKTSGSHTADLDNQNCTQSLCAEFAPHGITLSSDLSKIEVEIVTKSVRWKITDTVKNLKFTIVKGVVYKLADYEKIPNLQFPAFGAFLPPDLTFMGFPFTPDEARSGNGKFFILEERIGEPRFGLDVEHQTDDGYWWDNLAWSDFLWETNDAGEFVGSLKDSTKNKDWEISAAFKAGKTLQKPVRIAIHAEKMLP